MTEAWIETFLFIFLRFTGMIIVSPVFGRKNLPPILRIGFCLIMSIIIMLLLPQSQYTQSHHLFVFAINAIKEIALGMVMGYITLVVFSIAIGAGQIIDMQIGFGMSGFFDQQMGMQIAITGNFLNIILLLVFFATDGHHKLIQIMFGSFELIAPGKVLFNISAVQMLVLYFGWFMILVIQVAMPIIAVSILTELALGVIVKTMPQMNVFVVGIPLKIILGLVVMMLFLSAFVMFLQGAFDQMFVWQQKIIRGLIAS